MPGDLKSKYPSLVTPAVTTLQTLASDTAFLAGWLSQAIDNTSVLAEDYLLGGEFQVAAAAVTAGSILVMGMACYGITPVWPGAKIIARTSGGAAYTGSNGDALFTIPDTEQCDGPNFVRIATMTVDTGNNDGYGFGGVSAKDLFGNVPPYFAMFVAHSSVSAIVSAVLYAQPVIGQYT